jgi:hypothetical protein
MDKATFLEEAFLPLLKNLPANAKGKWGVLSGQGMVEHMTESFAIAWGRIQQAPHTPAELLERYREFALSDKPFKEGTKNAYMDDVPAPLRNASMQEALKELENEIKSFFNYYKSNPGQRVINPFFGSFNSEEWIHLLHKHALHHLKQFDLKL